MKNLIQFSTGLVAFGCKLNYISSINEIDIAEPPKEKYRKRILESALHDIVLFEGASNFSDGICVLATAEFVDGEPNPLSETTRLNMLNALGIMKGDRYVLQVLNRDKVNRSWHISEEANTCTYFGEICTHRGILDDPHRRGRKSDRPPEEYHPRSSKGIGREQLVTPNVQALYSNIPESVTTTTKREIESVLLKKLEEMPPEKLKEFMEKAQELLHV
jgi:hypothetical protein